LLAAAQAPVAAQQVNNGAGVDAVVATHVLVSSREHEGKHVLISNIDHRHKNTRKNVQEVHDGRLVGELFSVKKDDLLRDANDDED